jgi:hypothetical protein
MFVARAVLVVVLMVLAASPVNAQCGCEVEPTCRGFLGADFVFTAKATAVRLPAPVAVPGATEFEPDEGRAALAVGTVYRGIVPAALELTAGGECEASFEVGREYLVYATSLQDAVTGQVRIAVDGCSRTRLLADAAGDLALIKSFNSGRPEGSLYGAIIPADQIEAVFDDAPLYTVTLRGDGGGYERKTTGGRYEFNALPPGSYDLTIARGSSFEMRLTARLEEQACFDAGYISVP